MSYTVLIVDDEKIPREILRNFLPWETLRVDSIYEAEDGEQALTLVRSGILPDIIISDVKMPRMNGLELAKEVRSLIPECQFIFLSGYSDKEYLKGAIRLKAASYVEKPIDIEELTEVLLSVSAELEKAKPDDPRLLFFRSRTGEPVSGRPPGLRVYLREPQLLEQLAAALKANRRQEAEQLLARLYHEIRLCESTDPKEICQLYCQIILLFLNASKSFNLLSVARNSEQLLCEVSHQRTLYLLHQSISVLCASYFDSFTHNSGDPHTKVDQYIEKHYTESALSVQSMAQELGFTNTYLCAAYKKSCGKTINQRLTEVRIEHAQELLCTSCAKLLEIARSVGYSDGKYFTKVFARETGITPKEYRERHRYEK